MSHLQAVSGVTVYKTGSRAQCLVSVGLMAVFVVVGVAFLYRSLAQDASPGDIPGAIFSILFGGVPAYLLLTQECYEIQVDITGMICFKRVLNQVLLPARSIVTMKKRLEGEDDDTPMLYIRHERGEIKISAFSEREEFVAHMLRLNPTIKITGSWTKPCKNWVAPAWIVVLGKWLDKRLGSKAK